MTASSMIGMTAEKRAALQGATDVDDAARYRVLRAWIFAKDQASADGSFTAGLLLAETPEALDALIDARRKVLADKAIANIVAAAGRKYGALKREGEPT